MVDIFKYEYALLQAYCDLNMCMCNYEYDDDDNCGLYTLVLFIFHCILYIELTTPCLIWCT